jgi:serine/threonine-protein kinase RsbW
MSPSSLTGRHCVHVHTTLPRVLCGSRRLHPRNSLSTSTRRLATPGKRAVCTVEVASRPEAVSGVRHHTRAVLARWGTGDGLAGLVELVVSELATNAVTHAGAGAETESGPRLCLTPGWGRENVTGAVRDPSPRALPVPRGAPDMADHGRGLVLVAALAKDWGTERLPRGKRVWCLLARE